MRAVVRCAVGAVGVAGLVAALVGCGDDDDGGGDAAGSVQPVVNEDHWHAAFGVYVCDEFLPALPESESPVGIHTHGDGVIHIHPFSAEAAGENATLDVFFDGAGIAVSSDEMQVAGETYSEGDDTCDGEAAEITIVRWADVQADDAEPEQVDAGARFHEDGEGYVLAFVTEGTEVAEIPKPDSAAQLAELGAIDTGGGSGTTGPTGPTGPATTAPEDRPVVVTDERSLADGFYPVEAFEPAPCRSPGMRPDRENTTCYRLPDEPAAGTDIVEEAEAELEPTTGGWSVALVLTADGIDAFNEVAAVCAQFGPTCPHGQLALLVDGEVVTAPTIQEPSFERDQIMVSGNFTDDEAEALAEALAG